MGAPDAVANAQQYCGVCERKGAFRVVAGSPAGRRRRHPSAGPTAVRSTVLFVRERLNRRAPWLIRPLETRPGFARGRERAPACDAIACAAGRFARATAKTVAFASAEIILPQSARKCAIGSAAGRLFLPVVATTLQCPSTAAGWAVGRCAAAAIATVFEAGRRSCRVRPRRPRRSGSFPRRWLRRRGARHAWPFPWRRGEMPSDLGIYWTCPRGGGRRPGDLCDRPARRGRGPRRRSARPSRPAGRRANPVARGRRRGPSRALFPAVFFAGRRLGPGRRNGPSEAPRWGLSASFLKEL